MITTILINLVFLLHQPIMLGADTSPDFKDESTISMDTSRFFEADHPNFNYSGRIDFTNPKAPKYWAAGVTITATYKGNGCTIYLNDNNLWGKYANYVQVIIDDVLHYRLKLYGVENKLVVGSNLPYGKHTITISKNTESSIGYLEFIGLECEELLTPPKLPERKIEFIGNSITCGTGAFLDGVECDKGEWYDQHNAYFAYGPKTARALNAQWHLSSVSGIGMVHSCCDMDVTIADVFDYIGFNQSPGNWDFKQYVPDVVTICLGQNDGIQDSTLFCATYLQFIDHLRTIYPEATIVCLTSPMGNNELNHTLKNYLNALVESANNSGDDNIYVYSFRNSYNAGCSSHPSSAEHTLIANELTEFIKTITPW